ncbi:MAG: VOC family protein [Ilumatobacter sp.]|uniref:VOC family protein n=1 Tax=Ilumatobacter sp. TaxID=1967498 RepID=UPI0032970AF6
MPNDPDHGGEAPCWAHLVGDLDEHPAPLRIAATNTILYTDRWSELVDFYRTRVGLRTSMERDWFIEFELHPGVHLSVADAHRASIASGDGAGLTLSWCVEDAVAVRDRLVANEIEASTIHRRWGSPGFFVFDPAGNRIEFWSEQP